MNTPADKPKKTPRELAFIILIAFLILGPLAYVFIQRQSEEERQECISQMKQFSGAIKSWSLENRKPASTVVQPGDITGFLKNAQFPACPSGGHYEMRVGNSAYGEVSCSTHGVIE